MKKSIYIIEITLLAAIIFGLAWAEQLTLTLTTYYPAPYGAYREFTTLNKTVLATDPGANVGIGTDTPAEKLDVSGNIHATGDICTDQGGGVCLSSAGSGWRVVKIGTNVTVPTTWQPLDLSPYGVTKRALVLLKIKNLSVFPLIVAVRPNGDGDDYEVGVLVPTYNGTSALWILESNKAGTLMMETDASGIIEWKAQQPNVDGPVDLWLLGFVTE